VEVEISQEAQSYANHALPLWGGEEFGEELQKEEELDIVWENIAEGPEPRGEEEIKHLNESEEESNLKAGVESPTKKATGAMKKRKRGQAKVNRGQFCSVSPSIRPMLGSLLGESMKMRVYLFSSCFRSYVVGDRIECLIFVYSGDVPTLYTWRLPSISTPLSCGLVV